VGSWSDGWPHGLLRGHLDRAAGTSTTPAGCRTSGAPTPPATPARRACDRGGAARSAESGQHGGAAHALRPCIRAVMCVCTTVLWARSPLQVRHLLALAALHDVIDLDGAVRGASGQALAVVVELHVVLRGTRPRGSERPHTYGQAQPLWCSQERRSALRAAPVRRVW
jgi:hypothetical protein